MTTKRPIDRLRDSAVSIAIDPSDDNSAITCMIPIAGVMHIVKEKAIYAVKLADHIDPQRTNAQIPNTVQRVLARGSDSELVGRTLLTAKTLFDAKFLPKSIDHERALALAFEALKEFVSMLDAAADYQAAEAAAIGRFTSQDHRPGSLLMPAIGDVRRQCKAFAQQADHAAQALFKIVKLFYADVGSGGFESLLKSCTKRYGADDPFTQFITHVLPFVNFVRHMRNCLEHDQARHDQEAIITDFALGTDRNVTTPSIEVRHRKNRYAPVAVSIMMHTINTDLPLTFEEVIAHLCSKHAQPFGKIPIEVILRNEPARTDKHVRFCYGMQRNGQMVPIG
jgi:hypothetical protein